MRRCAISLVMLLVMFGGCDCKDSTSNNANNGNNANNTNNSNNANNRNNISDVGARDTSNIRDVFEQPDLIFTLNDGGVVYCQNGVPCACSDGMDNDGDGLIDGFDPECTGPYDDDEETFATGIPGDNKDPKWQDCFFDGNSGAGDDKCRYHTDCLTGDKDQNDKDCQVSQQCFDNCRPRTPNGCDCFGCCEVFPDGMTSTLVSIGGGCSLDNLAGCDTCVQTTECLNTCGECELCPGKTIDDLPPTCSGNGGADGGGDGGGPINTCEDGEVPCTVTANCPNQHYCAQGCCLYVPG